MAVTLRGPEGHDVRFEADGRTIRAVCTCGEDFSTVAQDRNDAHAALLAMEDAQRHLKDAHEALGA